MTPPDPRAAAAQSGDVNPVGFNHNNVVDLNQRVYQRLKRAVGLNLRRQIFFAVCDDLRLRNDLAMQLHSELSPHLTAESQRPISQRRRRPRLVSLKLNLRDPNPFGQAQRWLKRHPHSKARQLPSFQILGIEHLTRQPVSVQRLFLHHLQRVDHPPSNANLSLLLWVTLPWFRTIQHSVPEFWHCRTGIFEFAGDPTPVKGQHSRRQALQHGQMLSEPGTPQHSTTPTDGRTTEADLWQMLTQDLAQFETHLSFDDPQSFPATLQLPQLKPGQQLAPSSSILNYGPTGSSLIPFDPDNWAARVLSDSGAPQSSKQTPEVHSPNKNRAPKTDLAPVDLASATVDQGSPVAEEEGLLPRSQHLQPSRQAFTELLQLMMAMTVPDAQAPNTQTNVPSWEDWLASLQRSPIDPQVLQHLQTLEQLHHQSINPTALADEYRALGNIYRHYLEQGETTPDHLAVSIQAYHSSLQWLEERSPLWVDVLNDLGNLYWMCAKQPDSPVESLSKKQVGQPARQNLTMAIESYHQALAALDSDSRPQTFAMIQSNLGTAYTDLARYQEGPTNLQRAIAAYRQSLRYRQPDVEPHKYASTQNNLGTAYWNLAQIETPGPHLKNAIAAYSEALQYFTVEQDPLHYAMIQNNLGTAYWNLAQEENTEKALQTAIEFYWSALVYRTVDKMPAACAATQNNLGTAYWHLANHHDDPVARLEYRHQAIAVYESAIAAAEAAQKAAQPLSFDCFATYNNLGLVHYQLATDPQLNLDADTRSQELELALTAHIQALEGWQAGTDLYDTALNCIVQTTRAFHTYCGLNGQNLAFSKLPADVLAITMARL